MRGGHEGRLGPHGRMRGASPSRSPEYFTQEEDRRGRTGGGPMGLRLPVARIDSIERDGVLGVEDGLDPGLIRRITSEHVALLEGHCAMWRTEGQVPEAGGQGFGSGVCGQMWRDAIDFRRWAFRCPEVRSPRARRFILARRFWTCSAIRGFRRAQGAGPRVGRLAPLAQNVGRCAGAPGGSSPSTGGRRARLPALEGPVTLMHAPEDRGPI